jgi:sugar lactone lactonase YvrE
MVRMPSSPFSFDRLPDGICLDAEGAIWYADVSNRRCVRVREGGEVLQTIDLDCFACMLGGADRRTLFMVTIDSKGPGVALLGSRRVQGGSGR